jgi:superfamily I DNA/RNA helicase
MAKEDIAVQSVMQTLKEKKIQAVFCSDSSLPDILILDEKFDVAAVHVCLKEEFDSEKQKILNRKALALKEEIRDILGRSPNIGTTLALVDAKSSSSLYSVSIDFLTSQQPTMWDQETRRALWERFNPTYTFATKKRIGVEDANKEERQQLRLKLSNEQKFLVDHPPGDVLWIKGPPGSGKSLVLLARAKKFATENPSWRIQVVTFNRSLKRYFSDQLSEFLNVKVSTFGEFTRQRRQRFKMYSLDHKNQRIRISASQAKHDLDNAIAFGIDSDIDAMFIDEAQDFYAPWLRYCILCCRKASGAVSIAGDPSQSIYIDSNLEETMKDFSVTEAVLPISFRNTRRILKLVEVLTGAPQNLEGVPDGLPPELIYVNEPGNRNALNLAVIKDVIETMKSGIVKAGDIAVLVSRNHLRLALHNQLRDELRKELKYEVLVRAIEKGRGDSLSMEEDSIKVTTIHNAKGLEFPVVFILGLDLLNDASSDDEKEKIDELLLVAPTRGRDKVLLYISGFPSYLENLRKNCLSADDACVLFRVYPDDYD